MNFKIHYILMVLGVLFFYSCKKDISYSETRLFRPVLNKPLSSVNNTIIVNLGRMKSAVSYKVEISRDNFATAPIKSIESDTNIVVLKELLWNTVYQVRAVAYAADPNFNSKVAEFGEVKTERFPSILNIPQSNDIIDIGLNVRWIVSDVVVSDVKIFDPADEELLTPLASYETSENEQATGLKTVKKLDANTSYTIAIYSGDNLRGYETFTTKPALPTEGSIVDLRGVDLPDPDNGSFLFDQLTNAAPGSTVILDGDQTYKLKTYYFEKALTIKSGYSLTSGGAIIDLSDAGQFEIAANATIGSIVFDGVAFLGTTSKYVFNAGAAVSSTVAELKFLNCSISSFRDLIRTRSQWVSGGIDQLTIDNCIISDFGNSGLILVDAADNNPIPRITFKNSTFWKIQKLINNRARSNSISLIISDCSFIESPKGGQLIEYINTTNIENGILVTNTIFGRGLDNGGATPYDNPFVKSGNLPSTVYTFVNTFKTNDFLFTDNPSLNMNTYNGSITDLWEDPLNGNLIIKDKNFVGRSTAGDPRWRQ